VEALLTTAVGIMRAAVEEFEVLREMTAANRAKAGRRQRGGGNEAEDVPPIDVEAVRAGIDAGEAAALAERWYRTAKHSAIIGSCDDRAQTAYAWQWLQEEYGVGP
jgi:hypothetical protein